MRVAAVQMGATPDREQNLNKALAFIESAVISYQPDLVCLPELFYAFPGRDEALELAQSVESFARKMSPVARRHRIYLVAGSFVERGPDGRLFNTALAFDRDGRQVACYRKINLFNALGQRESDIFSPGEETVVFPTEFGNVGIIICYDLRFPETYMRLCEKDARVVAVPAAFYSPRTDHWEVLNRFLAMNNQVYTVAANQVGCLRSKSHVFCGRSMVVDPWGVPVATAGDRETVCFAEIDFDYLESVRQRLPLRGGCISS